MDPPDFGKPPTRIVIEPAPSVAAAWGLDVGGGAANRDGRRSGAGHMRGFPSVGAAGDTQRGGRGGPLGAAAALGGPSATLGVSSTAGFVALPDRAAAALGALGPGTALAGGETPRGRCAPSLAGVLLPFWRAFAVLAASLALCLFLARDAPTPAFRRAWVVVWPLVLVLVACEALYIVQSMYREKTRGLLIGLSGLVRLLDVWLAWALCFGNIFMLFHIHGRHSDFSGMTTLTANATTLEAWGFFATFSLIASFGGGLVGMEPATGWTRLAVTAFMVLTCIFVVLVVYAGASETARRERRPRRPSLR